MNTYKHLTGTALSAYLTVALCATPTQALFKPIRRTHTKPFKDAVVEIFADDGTTREFAGLVRAWNDPVRGYDLRATIITCQTINTTPEATKDCLREAFFPSIENCLGFLSGK